MARKILIGGQDFEKILSRHCFYIDKTDFIREWWESEDEVTLITRPRRFGKTLNMNMLERFFSVKYKDGGEIFEGLSIWKEAKYREIQGSYPVIFLSFAGVKADNYEAAREQIFQVLETLYVKHRFLAEECILERRELDYFNRVGYNMSDSDAVVSLQRLADYLHRYYGQKVIILLNEYDTPLQEAYRKEYWEKLVSLTRGLFNNTFKTNPYLERAVMTGITRVSKESFFSDLNNLNVVTVTSDEYASSFGFTEAEVFAAMDEFGMMNKDEVKQWYDGFTIGGLNDIYNPWSIINFLSKKKLKTYWVNTSSNKMISDLIRQGNADVKKKMEDLLEGKSLFAEIDEEIVFDQLNQNENAIWSLLLASGCLKVLNVNENCYELTITNYETKKMFRKMVKEWFQGDIGSYNGFINALLQNNLKEMNAYMKRVSLSIFSSFDGGNHPSDFSMPEKFYHGFVLGLLVELQGRYELTSNRESGFGRYDVMLRPLQANDNAIIMEFKVHDPDEESSLEETVQAAHRQIKEKKYEQALLDSGIAKERIHQYGFAFEGKKVLIA